MKQELDFSNVLTECKEAATTGYKLASLQQKKLSNSLQDAADKIRATILDFKGSSCLFSSVSGILDEQLVEIGSELNRISFAFKDDLTDLHENLSKFSITLFGRTMAGKSTLMELLTHGDGSSIGTGSQRTTQDIRTYTWNGLNITDVPGIAAFNGREDELIAFEAARKADLVLFLLTDDAPQEAEAECLAEVINLGKPVVCVMNVKASITEDRIKLGIRSIEKRFDLSRLEDIRRQFLAFSNEYEQSWNHIPFVYVHLKSAFIAQNTADQELSTKLHDLSRISALEKCILSQVSNKGRFYRIKNFIDIISNPLIFSSEKLLAQSIVNSTQGRTIVSKKRQLETWRSSFSRDGISRIRSQIEQISFTLHNEAASFAEEHFDDNNASHAWNEYIKEQHIQEECQRLLENLSTICSEKLSEVAREISAELDFTSSLALERTIRMNAMIDGKRIWDWTAIVAGGGLSIGAIIAGVMGAACAGPLGWAALAVGVVGSLGSLLFNSHEKQVADAKAKLEQQLSKNIDEICTDLQAKLEKVFRTEIVQRIDTILHEVTRINSVVFQLADTQKELAWGLNNHLLEMNRNIISEALRLIDADGLQYHIQEVARIPGHFVLLQLNDNVVFPDEQKQQLQRLINEQINFVFYCENKRQYVVRILGKKVDRNKISYEERVNTIHIPKEILDAYIKGRMRLAQQLSKTIIIPE